MSEIDSLQFVPEKLRQLELYPKLQAMLNHVLDAALTEFADVRYKDTEPSLVDTDVITNIINERGFQYISDIMSTITGFEFNTLLEFIGLVNLLKGSRAGLELILHLLSLDALITEWWENFPPTEADTFVITVVMNTSFITDPLATLEKVKAFCYQYVYPTISNIDFKFSLEFATKNVNFGGFSKAHYTGLIAQALPI